ncbi:hypothetical protein EV363DRAFT_1300146 [Boletus edulis]|nr:hypothetical protein EV363DRAFT_1300146 [Boletus edulis]
MTSLARLRLRIAWGPGCVGKGSNLGTELCRTCTIGKTTEQLDGQTEEDLEEYDEMTRYKSRGLWISTAVQSAHMSIKGIHSSVWDSTFTVLLEMMRPVLLCVPEVLLLLDMLVNGVTMS